MEIGLFACIGWILLFQIILQIETRIVVGYIVLFKKKVLNQDEQEKRMELFSVHRLKGFAFDILCFVLLVFLRLTDPPLFPYSWVLVIFLMFATTGVLLYITQVWIGKEIKKDDCIYNHPINGRQGSFDIIKASFVSMVIYLLLSSFVELFMLSVPIGIVVLSLSSLLYGYILWKKIIPTKPLLFYMINEFTDDVKYCERMGMKPYKTVDKVLDHQTFQSAVQYSYRGYIYEVLVCTQCYSDAMVVLMRLPKLTYEDLLDTAVNSKHRDERVGALGVILKDHPNEFRQSLESMIETDPSQQQNQKNTSRMSAYVDDLITDSQYIEQLETIRDLCVKLETKYRKK